MNTHRPAVITIAAILLIVLSFFVAGVGIASQYGLLGQGFGNRQFVVGQLRNDQNNPGGTQNFTPTQQMSVGFARIFRLIRPVSIAFNVILLVLAFVAAIGLFKSRRWAATLTIVLASLLFMMAIPGFLRISSVMVLIENVVRMLLAVAVVALLLLPSARKSYLPVKETL